MSAIFRLAAVVIALLATANTGFADNDCPPVLRIKIEKQPPRQEIEVDVVRPIYRGGRPILLRFSGLFLMLMPAAQRLLSK